MPLQEHLHPPLMLSCLTESFQMYVTGLWNTVYSFFRYKVDLNEKECKQKFIYETI